MKSIVVLFLPSQVAQQMFRDQDLEHLKQVATVIGPILPENGRAFSHALAEAAVLITGWGTPAMSTELLNAAPKLKLLAHSAGSVKHLAQEIVYDRGIRVVTAAAMNAIPVADFTLATMVSLLKQVPWIGLAHTRGDQEEVHRRLPHVRELADIEIGIIGASRIGRLVIHRLRSFPNVTIKLYDPHLTDSQFGGLGAKRASLEEVCRCEVVSLHAPLLPETRHMIDARHLALLPDHAVLINTARGALIDENALAAELNRRPIYTALDVTDPEPMTADSPLRSAPNLLITPHIAGAMQQARKEMGKLVIDETIRFLTGQSLQHEVTRAMLATQA